MRRASDPSSSSGGRAAAATAAAESDGRKKTRAAAAVQEAATLRYCRSATNLSREASPLAFQLMHLYDAPARERAPAATTITPASIHDETHGHYERPQKTSAVPPAKRSCAQHCPMFCRRALGGGSARHLGLKLAEAKRRE